ncbi:MAG TPA: ATP-binding protein [Nevskia sp.]|nr:ATP-binding protein [Nevskia sp.]
MSPEASQPAVPAAPAAASAASGVAALCRTVAGIAPATTVAEVADIIRRPEYAGLLCLPVVDHGKPVGTISRNQLTDIFMLRFGRELYGARPVTEVMNQRPLLVDENLPLDAAAQYVADHIGTPISEDFLVTRQGRYLGVGVVIDLLGAMKEQVARNAAQLADAYGQLKSSQTALVQSEKMASLGQMVAGVAHEINTPLGYVRNNVEMVQGVFGQMRGMLGEYDGLVRMLTDDNTDEQALSQLLFKLSSEAHDLQDSKLLEDAETLFGDTLFGVDTIKELVINLRNFSRLDAAKVAEVSLNDCLDQTLVIANNVLRNKVEIIKRYGEIPPVPCSPSQINQVLLNMMSNAAQAIEHEQGKLLLKTEAEGSWVKVSIQDNGKGISPENLQKIFDPFFTTKPVGQGTGLGLSISYQIVQAHGGTIHVASVPGKGTKFVISLPLAAADPSAAAGLASAA